jgi:hypothetical protein
MTAGGRVYSQPLIVRADPTATPSALAAAETRFERAMRAYDAMDVSHRGFLQLARVRTELRPLLASSDPDVAAAATDLDTRLAAIDGSDWTGLVIPDADNGADEAEEDAKEGKHPDFVPPKPVSLSKDYDDPTSILGRAFENVDPAPAFAILSAKLGDLIERIGAGHDLDTLAAKDYGVLCGELAGVLDTWRAINTDDLPRVNADLATRGLPPISIAADVPAIGCGAR